MERMSCEVSFLVEMLGRDDDLGHADGLAVFVADRDLALRIRTEKVGFAALAGIGPWP